MGYKRTIWQDEVTEYPYRYKETDAGNGMINHEPKHGETIQQGTPQNATNFNNMEVGVEDSHLAESIFLQYYIGREDKVDRRLDEHDEEFSAENGTFTLTNTGTDFFAFNSSGKTIALQKNRNTMNYDLDIEVTSFSGGQVGDVIVYDRQLNGFKLRYEGSATSVSGKYKVRGGMYA